MIEHKARFYALAFVFIAVGCSTSPPASAPVPEREPVSAAEVFVPAIKTVGGSWRFTPSRQPHRYTSITTVDIEEISPATGSAVTLGRESLVQEARYSISLSGNPSTLRFSGTVEAFSNTGGSRVTTVDRPAVVLPVSFSGRLEKGSLVIDELTGQSQKSFVNCATPTAFVLSVLQRNIQAIPAELMSGSTWTDSSTTSICTGSTPSQITAIRTYRVLGEADYASQKVIVVERSDQTRATGDGSDNQHRVLFNSTGVGTTRIYVDPTSGVTIGTEGDQRTTVVITASGRSQQFLQSIKEKTTLNQ